MNFLCSLYSCGDIFDEKYGERVKKKKYRDEQIGKGSFSIPQYNLSLSTCIPNMKFLSLTVLEISLTKKCYGITEGLTDRWKEGQM